MKWNYPKTFVSLAQFCFNLMMENAFIGASYTLGRGNNVVAIFQEGRLHAFRGAQNDIVTYTFLSINFVAY